MGTVRKTATALALIFIGAMFLQAPAPFCMRVVDAQTGEPVANILVTTDSGRSCQTLATGSCYWWALSLMNRAVRFEATDARHQFDDASATLIVTHAGQAVLKVQPRLYR